MNEQNWGKAWIFCVLATLKVKATLKIMSKSKSSFLLFQFLYLFLLCYCRILICVITHMPPHVYLSRGCGDVGHQL